MEKLVEFTLEKQQKITTYVKEKEKENHFFIKINACLFGYDYDRIFPCHGPRSPLLVNIISHLGGNVHICCFAIFETLVAKLLNLE
jgi:hypothetical protein